MFTLEVQTARNRMNRYPSSWSMLVTSPVKVVGSGMTLFGFPGIGKRMPSAPS